MKCCMCCTFIAAELELVVMLRYIVGCNIATWLTYSNMRHLLPLWIFASINFDKLSTIIYHCYSVYLFHMCWKFSKFLDTVWIISELRRVYFPDANSELILIKTELSIIDPMLVCDVNRLVECIWVFGNMALPLNKTN